MKKFLKWRPKTLSDAKLKIISNNTITSNRWRNSLSLSSSSNNSIYSNNITGGYYGIRISSNSRNNTISNNLIQSVGEYSIYITYSSRNKIYLNTFNSAKNAYDHNGFNSWDSGTVGNYWSDYNGSDNNSDGIGDTPYLKIETNAGGKDNYPLMVSPCNCTLLPIPTPTQPIPTVNSSGNVTRSISPPAIQPNSTLNITLTPSPSIYFDFVYRVIETIPPEFTFVSSTASLSTTNQSNVYTFSHFGSSPITYTLIAPSTNGSYAINGTFRDEDRNTGIISGIASIRVGGVNYDINGNGGIDRDEAAQAVLDYFNEIIPRQEAIYVVMEYQDRKL